MFGYEDLLGKWDDKFCSDLTSYICKGPVEAGAPKPGKLTTG